MREAGPRFAFVFTNADYQPDPVNMWLSWCRIPAAGHIDRALERKKKPIYLTFFI